MSVEFVNSIKVHEVYKTQVTNYNMVSEISKRRNSCKKIPQKNRPKDGILNFANLWHIKYKKPPKEKTYLSALTRMKFF